MAKMTTLFVLVNVCIALIAYRSSTYLQTDNISMDCVLNKVKSTSYGALDVIKTTSTAQAKSTQIWLTTSKDNIIVLTRDCTFATRDWLNSTIGNVIDWLNSMMGNVIDWLNSTIGNVIDTTHESISTVNDWVNEHIDDIAESDFGIWFMKNDPFKGRDTIERCIIHLLGILAIIACFIKVLIVETARLRYIPPKADDYQAYCRHIEALLSENDKPAKEMRVIPKHGLNKNQRRGIIDLSNKHLANVVLRRQEKERELKKKRKSKSLTSVLSVICGL
ncbi:unnamed protein product [Owenia fusiformis]|uniref:Uncharacterized protein n=1 Tax=Owenia fusiformis TaxID=6347 RepID=A0A8J1XXP9_OWEFU|nr:unnamed protein product [Owenia fusiformis]